MRLTLGSLCIYRGPDNPRREYRECLNCGRLEMRPVVSYILPQWEKADENH